MPWLGWNFRVRGLLDRSRGGASWSCRCNWHSFQCFNSTIKVGIGQSYLGIWLAHTGFGLPLAIYLLRNYMVGLPRDIIESAKVDGATDFQVFTKIVLAVEFPGTGLAFAIFQFLWTWNDLLVAKVFLPVQFGHPGL